MQMFAYPDINWLMPFLPIIIIWSMIWKGIGLWKAGRNNQLIWFVVMFLINSIGILPIIYLVWFQKKQEKTVILPKAKPKKKPAKKAK